MSTSGSIRSTIGRVRPGDEALVSRAVLREELTRAFKSGRAFAFYPDRELLARLAAGEPPEQFAGRFTALKNEIFERLAGRDDYQRARLTNDARLASRVVRGIRAVHLAIARSQLPSMAGRRYVLIKERLGLPTLCHVSAETTLLLHAGPGPEWEEIPSIYFGLNIGDVLRIEERKGQGEAFETLRQLLVLAARAIETGYSPIAFQDEAQRHRAERLIDDVVRLGTLAARDLAAVPEEARFAPFSPADREEHLRLLNERIPGDELNFLYDANVRAVESLEEHARQYKGLNDAASLHEVARLLVAASGHDVHEVRQRANLALERILAPKEYDAPPASRFINLRVGESYAFRFALPQGRDYFLRLYRYPAAGEFPLQQDLRYSELPLTLDEATGEHGVSHTFADYGQYDFVVFRRHPRGIEWLHEPGLSGRVNAMPSVRGEIILEIFTDIHGHTRVYWRAGDGHPGLVYNESGEVIRLGRFSDVTAHLADLQQRYLITGVYLLGVQRRGSHREDWAPQASSPSPFSPMSLTELEPSLGGEAEFRGLVAEAHRLGIKVIVDIVPHLNRHSEELGDEHVVQCYDEQGGLVARAATDGRYGSWNDGKLLNYRQFAVWQWLARAIVTLIERYDIDGIRFDSAHAVPIMMKRNNDLRVYFQPRRLAEMVEGRIVVNDREDEHYVTTGYYDSACRDLIAVPLHHYLMAQVEQALRRCGKAYFVNLAECFWGHERYLARSGVIPYNAALFKICENISHGKTDVAEVYHLYESYFPTALPEGTVLLGILGNHDERRALNTFGSRGLRAAIGLTIFLSDVVMDYEGNAEGESWKVFLDNIFVNWNQFESVSQRGLERFYHEWYRLHRQATGRGLLVRANNPLVAAAVRETQDGIYLGAFNFADTNQSAAIQLDHPELPLADDTFYRVVDPLYSPITGHYNYYTGRELRVSRLHTIVSFVERVKLLKLEPLADPAPHYQQFLLDSFSRLCDLGEPAQFEANFAFRELAAHGDTWRRFCAFVQHHLAQPLWAGQRERLVLGLKRAVFHLCRCHAVPLPRLMDYLERLANHRDDALRELGASLRYHHQPGPMVFLAAEAEPFSKSGGLANVVYELPRQLVRQGETVYVITPLYRQGTDKAMQALRQALHEYGVHYTGRTVRISVLHQTYEVGVHMGVVDGITYYLLDHGELFDGLYWGVTGAEKLRRRIGFARAAAETICAFNLRPLFTFTNDAFAGPFNGIVRSEPLYLNNENFRRTSFLHIIHNGNWQYFDAFQRWEDGQDLFHLFNLPAWRVNDFLDPVHEDRLNCMAAGIRFADRNFTVSPSYAVQIQYASDGLEHLLHDVIGISNGIGADFAERCWARFQRSGFVAQHYPGLLQELAENPPLRAKLEDRYPEILRGYEAVLAIAEPDRRALVTRVAHKLLLQLSRGLEVDPDRIVFCMIHRITDQKGFQLLLEASQGIFGQLGFQGILGGAVASGDKRGEEMAAGLHLLGQYYPRSVHVSFGFQDIAVPFLASDLVGMPSMSEPGGLVQLEAFACGALVVARATGGLRDTVIPIEADERGVRGNGFLFSDYSAWALYDAMERAARFFRTTPETQIHAARENARQSVLHWDHPARRYIEEAYALKEILRPPPPA